MLKKISHIILTLLIVFTTIGITISRHYCGDELKEISIITEAEPCCDIPDGCCHNESETYIIEDSFSITAFNYEFTQLTTPIPDIIGYYHDFHYDDRNILSWIDTPPPPNIRSLISKFQTFLL